MIAKDLERTRRSGRNRIEPKAEHCRSRQRSQTWRNVVCSWAPLHDECKLSPISHPICHSCQVGTRKKDVNSELNRCETRLAAHRDPSFKIALLRRKCIESISRTQ